MPSRAPSDVADVLSLLVREPGRPRVTWYGGDRERVELSGAVLDNWVAKTTNLLVEEYVAGPGMTALLDLPPHWRTVVWALAVWRTGGTVLLPGTATPPDMLVTDRPAPADRPAGAERPAAVIAIALPALARRFEGPLPDDAVDATPSVMTYGDVIGWAPPTDPAADALLAPAAPPLAHAALLPAALAAVADLAPGARTLLPVGPGRSGTGTLLLRTLGVLATGGSVVLLADDPADGPDAVADRTARVEGDERVTARLV